MNDNHPLHHPITCNYQGKTRLSQLVSKSVHRHLLVLLSALPAFAIAAGSLNPDVTALNIAETICVQGYTKTIRPPVAYTNKVKRLLLTDAGIDESHISEYELDHVIPLALGGHPTQPENLQLQPWEGENGAKRKDRIETKLQCLVCSGQVSLEQAQKEIGDDWQAAYHRYASVKCNRNR